MRVDLGGRVAMVVGGGALGRSVQALLVANGAVVGEGAALELLVNFDAEAGSGEAAAAMAARGGGRIVQVASAMGLVPVRGRADVAAAAAGVFARTRAMALEFAGRGVLVNAVATLRDEDAGIVSHIPSGRVATDVEIGNAVLFLLAPASGYVTGHILMMDGGWSAGFARDF